MGYSFAGQNPNGPLGGVRVELEYFYRQSKYDQTSGANGGVTCKGMRACAKKLTCEFDEGPTDRIGSITSHNLFGNVFYDFANTSRFTPYIGIGGGIGVTDADYGVWRTADKTKLCKG